MLRQLFSLFLTLFPIFFSSPIKAIEESGRSSLSPARSLNLHLERDFSVSQVLSSLDKFNKAIDFYSSGKYNDAISSFSNLLLDKSLSSSLLYKTLLNRSKLYLMISQPLLAYQDLQRLTQLKNSHFQRGEIDLLLGVVNIKLSRYKEGIKYLNSAMKIYPRNALLYSNRGVANQALGNFDKARRDLMLSASIDNSISTQYNIALLEKRLGNFAQCIKIITNIINNSSFNSAMYQQRGICYLLLGNTDSSIEDLLKAAALDKSNPITLEHLGLAVAAKGDKKTAIKYLMTASSYYLESGKVTEYNRVNNQIKSLN